MTFIEQTSVPLKAANLKTRLLSIDALRGLAIIFMLLDHVRETFYLHLQVSDPMDVTTTPSGLFISRLLAHLCAPTFIFLTGLSAYLYGQKYSGDRSEISKFLLQRGVFLVILEITLVNFAWTFQFPPTTVYLQVIWAIGLSMIALSALLWLPKHLLLVLAVCLIAGHNLLDGIHFSRDSWLYTPWAILHDRGWLEYGEHLRLRTSYPILPWIGVISLGFCFGPLFAKTTTPEKRRALLLLGSGLSFAAFVIIRAMNNYGDKLPWVQSDDWQQTIMSFFNVTKYPPSLLFLLLTLSFSFLLLVIFEKSNRQAWIKYLAVFGSVPMFYYLVHLYLLKLLYLIAVAIWGLNRGDYFGFSQIWQIWLCTVLITLLLYPLVKWFSHYKAQNRHIRWLKYF